jgi:hypothetical protein
MESILSVKPSLQKSNIIGNFEKIIYLKYSKQGLFFFNQLSKKEEYESYHLNIKGKGQLKLLLREFMFMNEIVQNENCKNKHYIVLYIGSGPGIHLPIIISAFSSYNISWHLYDTTEHSKPLKALNIYKPNLVKIFNRFFTEDDILDYKNKNIILISDIRTNTSNTNEPSSEDLLRNYQLQGKSVIEINPDYTLLKWRCLFPDNFTEFNMLTGLECLQCFNSKYSTEMFLIASKYQIDQQGNTGYHSRRITLDMAKDYEEKLFYYNKYLKVKNFEKRWATLIINNLCPEVKANLKIENVPIEDYYNTIVKMLNQEFEKWIPHK